MKTKKKQSFWDVLDRRQKLGKELVKQGHFTECYKVAYPDDPDVYCTCKSYNGFPD